MEPLKSPVREAAVAGQFYPGSAGDLRRAVSEMLGEGPARRALGVMAPHAGYIYSGAVAGEVYASVALPHRFVIIGPNHTGLGPPASLMAEGTWRLPGGDVAIDTALAGDILSRSSVLTADSSAHAHEHSIEVQLPFLQYLAGALEFVPVSLMVTDAASCRDVGEAVAAAIAGRDEPVLIVASSDMTHYESQEEAQRKDRLALDRILALDPDGLLETVRIHGISMCGVAPAAAMLYACKQLGAAGAEMVKYETSGDVTGDFNQVVGYAGVVVF